MQDESSSSFDETSSLSSLDDDSFDSETEYANIQWVDPHNDTPSTAAAAASSSLPKNESDDDDDDDSELERKIEGLMRTMAIDQYLREQAEEEERVRQQAEKEEERRRVAEKRALEIEVARGMYWIKAMHDAPENIKGIDLPAYPCHKAHDLNQEGCATIVLSSTHQHHTCDRQTGIVTIAQPVHYTALSYESSLRIRGETFGYACVHFGDVVLYNRHINEFAYLVLACLMRDRVDSHLDKRKYPPQQVVGENPVMQAVIDLLCNQYAMHELALLEGGKNALQFERDVDAIIDQHIHSHGTSRARAPKPIQRAWKQRPSGEFLPHETRASRWNMDYTEYVAQQLDVWHDPPPYMAITERMLLAAYFYMGSTSTVKDTCMRITKQQREHTLPSYKTALGFCDGDTLPNICKSSRNICFAYTTCARTALCDYIPTAKYTEYLGHYLPDVWTENAPPLSSTHRMVHRALYFHDARVQRPLDSYDVNAEEQRVTQERNLTQRFYRLFHQVFVHGTHPTYFRRFYMPEYHIGTHMVGHCATAHALCEVHLVWTAYALHIAVRHPCFSQITATVLEYTLSIMAEYPPHFRSDAIAKSPRIREMRRRVATNFLLRLEPDRIARFLKEYCSIQIDRSGELPEDDVQHLRLLMASRAPVVKQSKFYKQATIHHYVALVYAMSRLKQFVWADFYRAMNAMTTRIFSKSLSVEMRRYYWTDTHQLPVCIMPTLNRAMYIAMRAYFRRSAQPMPSLRLFYAPLTANVVYEAENLCKVGLRQVTMRNHQWIRFADAQASTCSVAQFRSNVALPVRYVYRRLPEHFLSANAKAAELVRIHHERHHLVAMRALAPNTDLGVLAALEWLYAEPHCNDALAKPHVYQLYTDASGDPYIWRCFLGVTGDRRWRIWLQLSTRHHGNHLRYVARTDDARKVNACFVATHPGVGGCAMEDRAYLEGHPMYLPRTTRHRRFWRLKTTRAINKGETLFVQA